MNIFKTLFGCKGKDREKDYIRSVSVPVLDPSRDRQEEFIRDGKYFEFSLSELVACTSTHTPEELDKEIDNTFKRFRYLYRSSLMDDLEDMVGSRDIDEPFIEINTVYRHRIIKEIGDFVYADMKVVMYLLDTRRNKN